jgi:hypothetical protein
MDWMIQVLILGSAKDSSFLQNIQTGSGDHPVSYSTGMKLTTTSTSAKVKNEWNCMSTPPVCLQGGDKDIFTFTTCRCHWHRVLCHINSHYAAKYLGSRATKDDILLVSGAMFLLQQLITFPLFREQATSF